MKASTHDRRNIAAIHTTFTESITVSPSRLVSPYIRPPWAPLVLADETKDFAHEIIEAVSSNKGDRILTNAAA